MRIILRVFVGSKHDINEHLVASFAYMSSEVSVIFFNKSERKLTNYL